MARSIRFLLNYSRLIAIAAFFGLLNLFAGPPQRPARPAAGGARGFVDRPPVVYSQPYFPAYGGFNGFYPPFYGGFYSPPPEPPKYWWAGPYSDNDPGTEGYNPNAGYSWDSVGALILETQPPNARVTLDGVFVGTSDRLGPFQLPAGEHTLRIEAEGYEPSERVLKVEPPTVEQLEIRLNATPRFSPKPAPNR
jgi:PEGA domain-containing protein